MRSTKIFRMCCHCENMLVSSSNSVKVSHLYMRASEQHRELFVSAYRVLFTRTRTLRRCLDAAAHIIEHKITLNNANTAIKYQHMIMI